MLLVNWQIGTYFPMGWPNQRYFIIILFNDMKQHLSFFSQFSLKIFYSFFNHKSTFLLCIAQKKA